VYDDIQKTTDQEAEYAGEQRQRDGVYGEESGNVR
jgi:hypothetical protein